MMKRNFISGLILLFFGPLAPSLPAQQPAASSKPAAEMEVILLGTGFPRPHPDRAGPATMVVVNGKVFVVDAGRGVAMRYWATGHRFPALRAVFLTHLHSDHTGGLPDLFNTSWVIRRRHPLELYGPPGTQQLADAMLQYFAEDIHIRRDLTEKLPAEGATINVHEIEPDDLSKDFSKIVYEDDEVRVTAFRVNHEPVTHAFGYKFEAGGKVIVISGDTRPSENLIRHARGADILIHEAYLPDYFAKVDSPEVAARLGSYHTTAEQAGEIAAAAGVKMLVLTHLVPAPDEGDESYLEQARRHFKGKIVVGRDLMRFTLLPPQAPAGLSGFGFEREIIVPPRVLDVPVGARQAPPQQLGVQVGAVFELEVGQRPPEGVLGLGAVGQPHTLPFGAPQQERLRFLRERIVFALDIGARRSSHLRRVNSYQAHPPAVFESNRVAVNDPRNYAFGGRGGAEQFGELGKA